MRLLCSIKYSKDEKCKDLNASVSSDQCFNIK